MQCCLMFVVVVVVVTLGVSLPALLLEFLYYIQVGGVSKLAIETRSLSSCVSGASDYCDCSYGSCNHM